MLVLVSLAGVLFFWVQAESSEEDYIEYLFADYVVAVASEAEDISFDQDTPLKITGELASGSIHLDPSSVDDGTGEDGGHRGSADSEQIADKPTEEEEVDNDRPHGGGDTGSE